MAQTFNDLYNEHKQQTGRRLYGFLLGMFAETATGIIKEHIIQITQGDVMKNLLTSFKSAAIVSFILVLPFVILEFMFNIVNMPNAFSLKKALDLSVLFGVMWLLPMAFIGILRPLVRNVQAGNMGMMNPFNLLFKFTFLAVIAMMWGGILIDQWPCFIGVPNCD
ncbi:hypothetical protein KJ068_14860 [bacterium]|nr:hypothetical protein [bacterium]